jgi:hypothetical protein
LQAKTQSDALAHHTNSKRIVRRRDHGAAAGGNAIACNGTLRTVATVCYISLNNIIFLVVGGGWRNVDGNKIGIGALAVAKDIVADSAVGADVYGARIAIKFQITIGTVGACICRP